MANIDDHVTALKNLVEATNNLAQTYLNVNGVYTVPGLTAATLIKNTSGRIATISVIVAGSAAGAIYDINTVAAAGAANQIAAIPNTVGMIVINLPFLKGLVITPGSGMTVAVSYS